MKEYQEHHMLKKWKKKLLSFALAFVMTAVIIPTLFATPAYAAGHTHDGVTFLTPISTLEQLRTLYANGGSGYLTADITSDHTRETINGKTVNLCLNGHSLTYVRHFLSNNSTFSVYDCAGNGQIASDKRDVNGNGGAIYVEKGSTFNLHSGTITSWRAIGKGSGVYVADATSAFNMSGGSIEDCYATYTDRYGVGVALMGGGKMTMSGGTIKNNTLSYKSKGHGGGVYVSGSTVEWDGASVPTTAQFVMTGGEISGNSTGWSGGGIMVECGSFLMTGGTISGNKSGDYGRGIAVYDTDYVGLDRSWAYIKGGTISGNSIQTSAGGRAVIDAQNVTLSKDTATYLTGACSYAYTIDYNANGGTNAPASKMGFIGYNDTANAKYVLPLTRPTRTGYTFADWFTAASGGTKVTEESIVSNIFEKQTLYAQWTPNTYTIAYNANGGDSTPASITATYDADVTLADAPTRTGYTFKEWNTVQGGTGTAYAAGASVKNLAASGTVTLYAQWTANTYTVTLNNGEGSGDTTVTATYDAVLPDVTVPTWEKHVFEGYFTEADGKGTQYIDKDGNGVNTWDKTADTTLCAFWKDSARVESMDLLLDGDIGMRYHVAVNDPELQQSGAMTVSIGSKKPSETTVPYSEAPKDESGAILFPFTVSSIQMAEPVTVEFKDKDGNVFASDARSVEDYYNLVENSSATEDQKEMVRTLVNYGYHAQQALSKTNGWSIGTDYKASSNHGDLISTADDLKAYRPVISGSDPNVKDIQLSLLLDNKTTLCVYVLTADKAAPAITVDGAAVSPEDNKDGWWLVRITDIDALNLSAMHTVTANGYTVYLSALSYASVAGQNTIDAMRALLDYYQATLTANGKKMLTSATVEQSEYEYTGQKIEPVLTVMAGNEEVEGYHVEWNGDLINAGTYTGLVTKEDYVGGVTVKVTIKPQKVTAPAAETTQFTYDGEPKTVLTADDAAPYTLEGNTATKAGNYTATATLNNTAEAANYCWTDGTTAPKIIEWSIAPMTVTKPTVETTSFDYDGEAKTVLTADEKALYTVSGNTEAEAGSYTATVALKDNKNTCWDDGSTDDISIEWSIVIVKTKVEIPAIPEATSFTYNGQAQTLEIAASDYYTVTGNTATNAGGYTAIVALNDAEHTCWSDESSEAVKIPWEITKKEIAVPAWTVNELTYTGEEQTGVTVEENAAYTLTGNTGTNAASYTAKLELKDTKNTCWSDEGKTTDAKTIVWSIARKKIGIPQAATGLVYNGAEQIGVKAGEGYGLIGDTKAINAGSYIATAALTDKFNTCWSDGTNDYQTIEWSIAKVDPKVLNGGISVTYHPNGGSVEFSGSMNVEGKFNYDPSNGTTFTPNDTQNYNTVTVGADVTKDLTVSSPNMKLDN